MNDSFKQIVGSAADKKNFPEQKNTVGDLPVISERPKYSMNWSNILSDLLIRSKFYQVESAIISLDREVIIIII